MPHHIAIDFGTTNSLVAKLDKESGQAICLSFQDLSIDNPIIPLIPSLVYIGSNGILVGETVRQQQLHHSHNNRLFTNFKRSLVTGTSPPDRIIDGQAWSHRQIADLFMDRLLENLPVSSEDIEQLVLTVPVAAFDGFVMWLHALANRRGIDEYRVRVVDEATAAALGYAIQEAGVPVLVVDFGGGTLDLSLVKLPEQGRNTGGFLNFLRRNITGAFKAEVLAKAGQTLGGSDIDQWLLQYVLKVWGLSPEKLDTHYATLLAQCEEAKIALSSQASVDIAIQTGELDHTVTVTQADLEKLLEENGLFATLRRTIDRVMQMARQRSIYKEDIQYVLMVGGTSLIPIVQDHLRAYFNSQSVYADKPFTAVVEGALQLAAGVGLQDYLSHSYALRYLDSDGQHQYEEIIPMGIAYPSAPVELTLQAAHANQPAVEIVIGEVDSSAVGSVAVDYEGGQVVFVAQADHNHLKVIPINAEDCPLVTLEPSGQPDIDRLRVSFYVDTKRRLRVTIEDLHTNRTLLEDVILTEVQ